MFDRSRDEAVVEFTEESACRYEGPEQMPRGEPLRIEIRNETAGELLWFALARLRPEVPVSLEELRADRTSSGGAPPAFISYGSFSSVPAGSTSFLDWVFVDADASWVVYCMRDPNPAAPMSWPSFSLWGGPELHAAAIISSGG